jgi:hypothetical protein
MTLNLAIQCWHCNDKPQWTLVVADKLPVCNETLNATTGQKEYGEKRECGMMNYYSKQTVSC